MVQVQRMPSKKAQKIAEHNISKLVNNILLKNTQSNQLYKIDYPIVVFYNKACAGGILNKHYSLNDDGVSNPHCKIIKEANMHYIEDLGSLNGTIINGFRIKQKTIIKVNDILNIGNTTLIVEKIPELVPGTIRRINRNYLRYSIAKQAILDAFTIDYLKNAIIINKGILTEIVSFTGISINRLEKFLDRYSLWGLVEESQLEITKPKPLLAEDNVSDFIEKLIRKREKY